MNPMTSRFLPLSSIYANRYGVDKMTLPMSSQALYSNFEHISGHASEYGDAGFGPTALHILDALIGLLQGVGSEPKALPEAPMNPRGSDVDALIQRYGAEVHEAATAATLPYSNRAAFAWPGTLFSLTA